MTAHWLLDVSIDGRPYRWAVEDVEVVTASGEVLVYRAGLVSDLQLAAGDTDVGVEVVDPTVDWPQIAAELEAQRVTIRRWVEGTAWEGAVVYVRGEVQGVAHGGRTEAVSWQISEASGVPESLGLQVPDPLAQVDATTWPVGGSDLGDEGGIYPVIFGFPGFVGAGDPVPVVPVPLAQWDVSNTLAYVVVSEDIEAQISSVYLRNDSLDVEGTQTVVVAADGLGRQVRVAHFGTTPAAKPVDATEQRELYVGLSPSGGGGVARNAYDVIVYLMRRWGVEAVDWVRLPEIRDVLSTFQVDTWIDSVVSDPWSWVESVLVPDLPVEVRTSARGRYLVAQRFVPELGRLVGSLEAGRGVERASPRRRAGSPRNEFNATFGRTIADAWRARIVLTGEAGLASTPAGVADPIGAQQIRVQRSGLCTVSQAKWGLRQAEPIEVDWTWDPSTVAAVLQWQSQRDAIPAWRVSYDVQDGAELVEGDTVEVTDLELGVAGALAVVDGPPVADRTRWAQVTLRIPAHG